MGFTEQFPAIGKDFQATFGRHLVSLSAHGVEVPLWWPARLVVVLTPESTGHLHNAHGLLAQWRKRGVGTPLFLTEADFSRSLDAFPLEFLNLKLDAKLLAGRDLFVALAPEPEMLRLQCEREIEGKAIVLRQAYAASTLREELLPLVSGSVALFLGVFRGLLHLVGEKTPIEPPALIEAASRRFDLDRDLFSRLVAVALGEGKKPKSEDLHVLVRDYLVEAERLAALADAMQLGRTE